jgi:hypothetical protein
MICGQTSLERQALELERRQTLVQWLGLVRDPIQQRLAERRPRRTQPAGIALRRRIDVLAIGANDTAVVACDELQRLAGDSDESVLIRMEPAVVALVERQVTPGRAAVR